MFLIMGNAGFISSTVGTVVGGVASQVMIMIHNTDTTKNFTFYHHRSLDPFGL